MHDAGFKSSLGERPFGSQMVVSSSFHNDDHVLNVVFLPRLANLFHCQLKAGRSMFQCLTFNQQIPEVVRHHPLGPILGWINTDNRELLTAHALHSGPNDTTRLLQIVSLMWFRPGASIVTNATVGAETSGHTDSPCWGR
jgi:hypothetical protein